MHAASPHPRDQSSTTSTIVPIAHAGKPLPQANRLLAALPPDAQDRLYAELELVFLPLASVVQEPYICMSHVYFPAGANISVQYVMSNGDTTGVAAIGNEGLLGFSLCLADDESISQRSMVQSAGYAFRLPGWLVRREFNRHEELLVLVLRYTQTVITQLAQTAVCNRRHEIEQRLCRWLLLSLDRLPDNRLTMTQEFISNMLGVRREGVTQAATKLRDLRVIDYARGLITVLDRPSLERLSCECYHVVRDDCARLLDYPPQRQTIRRAASISMGTMTRSHHPASRRA